MAVERTFAGWMRTAFGAIGIGIAFHALFGEFDPPYLAKLIATVFILLGAILAAPPTVEARTLGLLIGVADYNDASGIRDLLGPRNDEKCQDC